VGFTVEGKNEKKKWRVGRLDIQPERVLKF
jgi:hypothetical protein